MRILGLIPARGGSKGVPGKNSKTLKGKPLIAYTIEKALITEGLNTVVISTDDSKIAEISEALGAEVPFIRPSELASDESPTILTVLHALDFFQSQGVQFDAVCLLQATVPFRKKGAIQQAIEQFVNSGADSLISVREIPHQFNPSWAFEVTDNENFLKLAKGEKELITRRQDLPKAYYRDGSIYITKTTILLEKKSLYGDKITYLENKSTPLINIDTQADWELAEQYISENEG